jgi:hypothetical protein
LRVIAAAVALSCRALQPIMVLGSAASTAGLLWFGWAVPCLLHTQQTNHLPDEVTNRLLMCCPCRALQLQPIMVLCLAASTANCL